MPRAVRYILDGLGTPNSESADLISYLLFDTAFTRALIDIGYADADRQIGAIEALLCSPEAPSKDVDGELPSLDPRPARGSGGAR